MTRVDRMEQLLSSLRQQLLTRTEARGTETATAGSAQEAGIAGSVPIPIGELRGRISRELRSFDLKTAAGRRRARLSFIESVLSWDLGDTILRDPKLEALVSSVEEAMSSDAKVSGQLDEMLAALLLEATPDTQG